MNNERPLHRGEIPWWDSGIWQIIGICILLLTAVSLNFDNDFNIKIGLLDILLGLLFAVPAGWIAGRECLLARQRRIADMLGKPITEQAIGRANFSGQAIYAVSGILGIAATTISGGLICSASDLHWPVCGTPFGGSLFAGGFLFQITLWYRYATWYYSLPD